MTSRLLWALPLSLVLLHPPRAWGEGAQFARDISFQAVKTPPVNGTALLSPNGRWLTFARGGPKARGAFFYDLQTRRGWAASRIGEPQEWSADSTRCLSRSSEAWRVAYPAQRTSRLILSQRLGPMDSGPMDSGPMDSGPMDSGPMDSGPMDSGPMDSGPMDSGPMDNAVGAWGPQTSRLAIADGLQSTKIRFWDGRRWTGSADWGRVLKFPEWYRGEVTPSDLTWSLDGRLLALRFYGHAERVEGSALHTVVFSVRGRHLRDVWGEDTGEVRWLDGKRMMFKGDDGGMGGATELVVADPRTKRRRVWKSDVLAWALSARRDFVCALLGNGDLVRSSTRRPNWQMVKKSALARKFLTSEDVTNWFQLDISPRGDMVAISRVLGGRGLWIFSTLPRKPWTILWKAPTASASLIGWTQNRSLPLVQLSEGASPIGHLQKVRASHSEKEN